MKRYIVDEDGAIFETFLGAFEQGLITALLKGVRTVKGPVSDGNHTDKYNIGVN